MTGQWFLVGIPTRSSRQPCGMNSPKRTWIRASGVAEPTPSADIHATHDPSYCGVRAFTKDHVGEI